MKKFRTFLMLALVVMIFASVSVMSVTAARVDTGRVVIKAGEYNHWYPSSVGNTSNGWNVTKAASQEYYVKVNEVGYSMKIGLYYRPDNIRYPDFFNGTNTSTTIDGSFDSIRATALYRPYVENNSTVSMTVLSGSYFTLA